MTNLPLYSVPGENITKAMTVVINDEVGCHVEGNTAMHSKKEALNITATLHETSFHALSIMKEYLV
jgi:hypothetical protein